MHASHEKMTDKLISLFHYFTSMLRQYHSAHERRQLTSRIIQLLLTAIVITS